ncbi:uncharacterized protein LOC105850960 isoform X2 [Hydra vulgaris]|uniref:uncharacterized protein LOC105850960 isoform X2 n=1 Tax=Hydra vulgaris TaxID=6087 RepID=UPI001F5EB8EC|nr:uncharacterized protein LOC105850960 isoform X2 [Hydra vulgaris]
MCYFNKKNNKKKHNLHLLRMISLTTIMDTQQHKNWLNKRKCTFVAFSVQITIIGIDYSLTFLSLWLYIKEMINTNTPKLLYSLVSVSYILASFILTPFIGRIVDKKRNVKFCFLICNLLMMTGNALYCLPFSPLFLIIGKLISGFSGSFQSIIFSETIRSYPAHETRTKLSILSIMFNLGLMLGPGINFTFKDINFFIGLWHLQYVNFCGLFMGCVYIVMGILTTTMVHDVSKEFDYKAFVEKNLMTYENDKDRAASTIENNEKLPIINRSLMHHNSTNENKTAFIKWKLKKYTAIKIFKTLFFHFDSALLLFANFFLASFVSNTDVWLPLLIIEKLNLSITEINICAFGSNGISGLILLLFIWRPFSNKKLVMVLVTTSGCYCIVSAANMVNSNVQTYVDSIRSSVFTAGALLAFVCSPYMFDYVEIFGTLYIAVNMVIGVLFFIRKNYYIYPKLLF